MGLGAPAGALKAERSGSWPDLRHLVRRASMSHKAVRGHRIRAEPIRTEGAVGFSFLDGILEYQRNTSFQCSSMNCSWVVSQMSTLRISMRMVFSRTTNARSMNKDKGGYIPR